MNGLLYTATVLIWGSTWLAIAWQVGEVAEPVSIFYRFILAAVLLLTGLTVLRKRVPLSWSDHGVCLLQGLAVFGLNFYCFYTAANVLPSGLISILFSMATLFNALNGFLLFRIPIPPVFYLATALGLPGMALVFWEDLTTLQANGSTLVAMGLSLLGTYGFSLGNMASIRHQRKGLNIAVTNGYAMLYGAMAMGLIGLLQGAEFRIPMEGRYLGALVYLAVIGSIGGFGAYFMLVGRIGAGRAAYATVLFPLVALALSTVFEGYRWQPTAVVGMAMILMGNLLMFNTHKVVLQWWRKPSLAP